MGYRSDVRCLIYGTKEQMDLLLTTSVIIGRSRILEHFSDDLIRYITKDNAYHVLDLSGQNWKWYDSYEDVIAWMEFMSEAQEMGLNYEFIRVGENTGDVESLCSDIHNFLYTTTPLIEADIDRGDPIPIL